MAQISMAGRLAADPETKQLGDYTVGSFTLGRNQYEGKGKDKSVAWWRCEVWGGLTNVLQYMRKGMQVYIEGEPRIDNPSEGKYYTKIKISEIILPDKGDGGGGGTDQALKERSDQKAADTGAGF